MDKLLEQQTTTSRNKLLLPIRPIFQQGVISPGIEQPALQTVLSRIKFLRKIDLYMRKLNKRKVAWIVRELDKGELSVGQIARQQGVTPRWARELKKRYEQKVIHLFLAGRVQRQGPLARQSLHWSSGSGNIMVVVL